MRLHLVAPCCFFVSACAGVLLFASTSTAQTQPAPPPPPAPSASTPLQALPAPPPTATPGTIQGPVWPQQPPAAQPGAAPYGTPGYATPQQYPPGYRNPAQGAQHPGYYPYPYPYQSGYGYQMQFAGPPSIAYEEGKAGPNGYHLQSQPRRGLVIAGAVTFGSTYLITLLAASAMADDQDEWGTDEDDDDESKALPLFIPVLGPFIGISTLDASPVGSAWLVLDGIAQGAGAAMLIAGLAYPNKRWVRNDLGVEWTLAPAKAGRGGAGLGLVGRF